MCSCICSLWRCFQWYKNVSIRSVIHLVLVGMVTDATSPGRNRMKRPWNWACLFHSQRRGEKPRTSGVHQSSVQMKNGLRHWGRNFLGYLEGYFLHELKEVSAVEAKLVTAHCLSSSSGCLFGNFVFAEACSHSSNEAK